MLSYLSKKDDTAVISIISCEQSKLNAAINGGDILVLDEILNDINRDDNIKHCVLKLTYYDDEKKVMSYYDEMGGKKSQSSESNNKQKCKTKDVCSTYPKKFICPECGREDALMDKDGNVYPCLSCLQIDIGKRISEKFSKEYARVVDKNNQIIGDLVNALKK